MAQARDWFARRADDLSPQEQRYVEVSLALRQRENEQKEAARQAEIARQRELAEAAGRLAREQGWRAKIAVVGVAVALLLAVFGGYEAYSASQQRDKADRATGIARNEALSNRRLYEQAHGRVIAEQAFRLTLKRTSAASIERGGALALASIAESHARNALPEADAIEAASNALSLLPLRIISQGSEIRSLVAFPDGRLASGGADGTIRLWDSNGQLRESLSQGSPVTALAVWNGRLASAGKNSTISLWDSDGTPRESLSQGSEIRSLAVSLDGQRLASGDIDGNIKIWEAGAGARMKQLKQRGPVTSLAVFPDGALGAGGDDKDGTINLWDSDGKPRRPLSQGSPLTALMALPDGRLVSGDKDNTVKVWPKEGTDKPTVLSHDRAVRALVALPDGRLAIGGADGTIRLWDSRAGNWAGILSQGSAIRVLAALPDGRLASGGADKDGTIKLWPNKDASEPKILTQERGLGLLALSPGGGLLASGDSDGNIEIWKAGTDAPMKQLSSAARSRR